MTSREELLDQYINNLNEGNRSRPATDDPELAELLQTAEDVSHLREPDWPVDTFARDLAANLSTQLTPDHNGHAVLTSDYAGIETLAANPWVGPVEPEPQEPGRLRRTIQIAGALAAFSVFALVLVFVFREVSDDNGLPLGAAPEDVPPVNQLAYSSSSSGNQEIYLINADGTGQVQLTNDPAADTWPAWSPDGTKIAFVSDRSGIEQVWVMDADGSNVYQVTHGEEGTIWPQWSPDGQMIAGLRGVKQPGGEVVSELFVFNTDGSNARSLSSGHGPAYGFEWSPDSQRIAVEIGLSGIGDHVLIYRVNGSGMGNPHVTDDHSFVILPSWSPDGSHLVLVEARDDGSGLTEHTVVVVNPDGPTSHPLSEGLEAATFPAWSPDGQYLSIRSSERGIFLVETHEPNTRVYVEGTTTRDVFPRWSPDSRQIAFIREKDMNDPESTITLMVANLDHDSITEVVALPEFLSMPAWRPIPPADLDDESQVVELMPTVTTEVTDEAAPMGSPTPTPIGEGAVMVTPGVMPTPTAVPRPIDTDPPATFPPRLWLGTSESEVEARFGSFQAFDDETGMRTSQFVEFVDLDGAGLPVQLGETISVRFDADAEQPQRIVASIYTRQDNFVIPGTSSEGVPNHSGFAPLTAPVASYELDLDAPVVELDIEEGFYIASVEVQWADAESEQGDLWPVEASYAVPMTVYVPSSSPSPPKLEPPVIKRLDQEQALQVARDFLNDQEFEADGQLTRQTQYGLVWAFQVRGENADGIPTMDLILVDALSHTLLQASIQSDRTSHPAAHELNLEEARVVAEDQMLRHVKRFPDMTQINEATSLDRVDYGPSDFYSATWQLQDPDSGALLPTYATITINLDTGLPDSFTQREVEFHGPTIPEISEADAIELARPIAEERTEEPDISLSSIDLIAFVPSDQQEASSEPATHRLVWFVMFNESIMITVDAITGEVFDSTEAF